MKSVNLILAILFLLLASFAVANNHDTNPIIDPIEQLKIINDFSDNPSVINFKRLNSDNQQQVLYTNVVNKKSLSLDKDLREMTLSYMSKKSFDMRNKKDLAIAENFFGNSKPSANAKNINQNDKTKELFSKYLARKGVNIEFEGRVSYYDGKSGTLKTSSQEINLNRFAEDGSAYSFFLDKKNQLSIVDRTGDRYTFTGRLESDGPDYLLIKDGTLEGHEIKDARFVIDRGELRGRVSSFHSLNFLPPDKKVFFKYNIFTDTLYLDKNQKVSTIKNAKVSGQDLVFPDGSKLHKGTLHFKDSRPVKLGKRTKATVGGMTHSTKAVELELVYAENKKLERLDNQEEKDLAANRARFMKKDDSPDDNPLFRRQQEEIRRRYQGKRNKEYDELIPKIKPEGNYFIYGRNRLWLGGSDFKSEVSIENPYFPDFNKVAVRNREGYTRNNRLSFTANGMELDLEKVSDLNRPLAFRVKMSGKGEVGNGVHDFVLDGEKVYDRTIKTDSGDFAVGADMRFEYDLEGEKKIYDFDVDTTFTAPLTPEQREELEEMKRPLEDRLANIRAKIKKLKQDNAAAYKSIKDKINAQQKIHDKISVKIGKLENNIFELNERLRNTDSPDHFNIAKKVKKLREELNVLYGKSDEVFNKIYILEGDSLYGEVKRLEEEESDVVFRIDGIDRQASYDYSNIKTGAFGQLVVSDDGSSKVSYQEYIQGFPIRKNAEALQWYEFINPNTDDKRTKRVDPFVFSGNRDVLDLDVLPYQECIDTQFRLAYEYARATGTNICHSGGKVCLRDPKFAGNPRAFLNKWMINKGTATYGKAVKGGNWKNDIQVIPKSNYDKVQPGDVLVLKGHAKGIKEIIEIPPGSGIKYARTFAGSMPAIDGRQYPQLIRLDQLKDQSGLAGIYRWRFKGTPRSTSNPYRLTTGGGIVK